MVLQQLFGVWSGLSVQRQVVAVLAALAMIVASVGLMRMATTPSMTLLYAGLENGAAGEVVQSLEARGIVYEIRGSSIFVDSTQRDELRLTLASEGLPTSNALGYELLDSLTGFGTTSQMFDAAYWRAKEGELARTIVSSPTIQTARVHIANPGSRPFQRDVAPTASVTVTTASGGLSAGHARALRFLVASAVAGLAAEDVSVIDARGGVVLAGDSESRVPDTGQDRAADIRRNVERLLEARVGFGKAVVEVVVETVTDREQITERRFDPEGRVAISSDTEESSTTSSDKGSADVTVASNLPDGDAAEGGDTSQSENSQTRERVNYEVSETQREILKVPGAIKRVSVAVLVDGIRTTEGDGTESWVPRPEDEMLALRELVGAAIGFDAERGDSLTLKTMEFEPVNGEGTPPSEGLFGPIVFDAMRLAQLGVLGIVLLLLGLFVVRPILTNTRREEPFALVPPAPGDTALMALTGVIADDADPGPDGIRQLAARQEANGDPAADPVARLRKLIDERQEESLEILKSWMEDTEEPA
jgi:flagellar M-ring protein FliF